MSGAARSEPHPLRELASQLTIPAAICLCIVVSFAGIALVAPWLAPYDEGAILTDDSLVPPGEDLLPRRRLPRARPRVAPRLPRPLSAG